MSLRSIAMTPALTVTPEDTVGHAIDLMTQRGVGAALVVEADRIVGIMTERDLLTKVLAPRRGIDEVRMGEVMTSPVQTFLADGDLEDALRLMMHSKFRHLPLVDESGHAVGMVSTRRIMGFHVDNLRQVIAGLTSYIGADGIGG